MSKDERYYVEYLGWKETVGVYGREFTDPIAEQLLRRTRHSKLPKLTLKLSREHIAITQEVLKEKKPSRPPEKVRYPLVAARDVAFSAQSPAPDADVVACIFLGYNPLTQCAVHVHVYRFDSPGTARLFDGRVRDIVGTPEHWRRMLAVESYLAQLGHVRRRRGSVGGDGGGHYGSSPQALDGSGAFRYATPAEALRLRGDIVIRRAPPSAGDGDDGRQNPFESVKEELEYKLKQRAPLLLPPKDYDTVVRRHGHVDIRDDVKARHASILGSNAIFATPKAKPFYNGAQTASVAAAAAAGSVTGESLMRRGAADGDDSDDGAAAERELATVSCDGGLTAGAVCPETAADDDDLGLSSGDGIYSEIGPRSGRGGGGIYSKIGPRSGGGGGGGGGGDDGIYSEIEPRRGGGGRDEADSNMAMYSYEFSYGHGATASGSSSSSPPPPRGDAPAAARIGRAESLHSWWGHVTGPSPTPKARASRSLYAHSAR